MWVGIDLDYLLEQLRPWLVLAVTLECIDTLFPWAQHIQPRQNGVQFILHRRECLFERQQVSEGTDCTVLPR